MYTLTHVHDGTFPYKAGVLNVSERQVTLKDIICYEGWTIKISLL
jgi:hypothetical protein